MRTIILAGGYAKRLWPLTLDTPKPLLPMGDGTILDFIIAKIAPLKPEEIIISTNRKFEGKFAEWIALRGLKNARVLPEPSLSEEEKLGPTKAISLIMKDAVPDDYVIAAGDNLFSLDLVKMAGFLKKVRSPVVALYNVSSKELARKYACVSIDGSSKIIGFEEKPECPKCLLVSTGIYAMPWASISRVEEYLSKGNPPDPIGKFIGWLAETEGAYGYPFKGYWYDIGSIESLKEAQETFRRKSFRARI
jgi:glucose-1-phosphate thymidylyltransferase